MEGSGQTRNRTDEPTPKPLVRIGELSRRVGVRPETLRAWERRYGLFEPSRTDGNYRLYSAVDEARARAMTRLLAAGVAAAEAARLARENPDAAPPDVAPTSSATSPRRATGAAGDVAESRSSATEELIAAIRAYDDATATALLDDAISRLSVDAVLSDVVLPVLRAMGDHWAAGNLSIAQEHFGSELLRGRLLGLARRWGAGTGPLALLACPPGERHEFGLLACGLALRERGWRIAYLGSDTPPETLAVAAQRLDPALVLVAATERSHLEPVVGDLRRIAEHAPMLLAGPGAAEDLADSIGAAFHNQDPVGTASILAAEASTTALPKT